MKINHLVKLVFEEGLIIFCHTQPCSNLKIGTNDFLPEADE